MKIYVYLDESGSIHKNSKTKYFAVGGYFTFKEDKIKIIAKYKKNNLKMKKAKNISLQSEIKSYNMTQKEKIMIFNDVQDIDTFYGCVKIFKKQDMKKILLNRISFLIMLLRFYLKTVYCLYWT